MASGFYFFLQLQMTENDFRKQRHLLITLNEEIEEGIGDLKLLRERVVELYT